MPSPRGSGTLGLDPNRTRDPQVIVIADTIALYPREHYEKGLRIVTAATQRTQSAALSPRIKSLNYLNNIMAKLEGLQAGCVEALMLNHKGEHFSVRGPLMIARSPQGQPVIVQAGQSDAGRELAAQTAEVVFSVQQHVEQAREYYADLKSRAAKYGRSPDSIKVMPGVVPVVGRTRAEAERKFEKLQDLIHPDHGVAMLSDIVGMDLSPYPLDGPLPEVPPHNSQQGRQKMVVDTARKEGLTIRQLYKRIGGARGHRMIYGTGPEIADALEEWYRTGAADGFNVMPPILPRREEMSPSTSPM